MSAPRLDPRPARPLTSREVAHIVGWVVTPLVAMCVGAQERIPRVVETQTVREAVRICVMQLRGDFGADTAGAREMRALVERPDTSHLAIAVGVLGSLGNGLLGTTPRQAVVDAYRWWAERADVWGAVAERVGASLVAFREATQ